MTPVRAGVLPADRRLQLRSRRRRTGSWIKQNPALTGSASVEGYLRSKKIAIAVVNTFDQAYYEDPDPSLPSNPSNVLFQKIGAYSHRTTLPSPSRRTAQRHRR